jgi:hypothetical protein
VSTTTLHNSHAHPQLGVPIGVKKLGFDGGVIEDKLVRGRVRSILGWLGVKILFGKGDPLGISIRLFVCGDVKVSRPSVGIFAVASNLGCRLWSRCALRNRC